jgi:prolyl 4-hydroxylase
LEKAQVLLDLHKRILRLSKRIRMKRININTQQPHFIGCWNLENNKLCNEIISFFENNKNFQKQGVTSIGKDLKVKSRTDISIDPHDLKKPKFEILKQYINELHKCFVDYQNQWPFLKTMLKEVDIGRFNIGRYSPGDHFASFHSERTSLNTLHRLFAWMTYLNDSHEGGQTSFKHYGIKIKPKIGKTLIWPAEWTHAHAGEVLKSGTKYIVTGWIYFPAPDFKLEK